MYQVYGIMDCDTVKKALKWLENHNVEFEFHDYKSKGISEKTLKNWISQVGWESLVNKKGMTWRQLDPGTQNAIKNEKSAIKLMVEKTSVIKRPLIESSGKVVVLGFDETEYGQRFKV